MNNEFQSKIYEYKIKNLNITQQILPLNNGKIKDNYFISNVKKISPKFQANINKNENLNSIYHSIKFRGKNINKEEIKNHDSYIDYGNKNNQGLFLINRQLKNINNRYYLMNHSPQNMHYNKYKILNNGNKEFQHNISPIKLNSYTNNKNFNSESKQNRNNFYDLKNINITYSKDIKEFNNYINSDDNNNIPTIPKNDTCIENFENLIIKKNQINIIPIPKKLKVLNNDIRKNLFFENRNQNVSNKINNHFSPPKKNFQNIDINIDFSYSNENIISSKINKSIDFGNKSSIKLSSKIKHKLNNERVGNNKKEDEKHDFSRQLNIRIKKIKNLGNNDFQILWSGKSKAGRDKKGNIKINQDAFRVCENVNNIKNFNFYILCDGHGKDGHYVSKYITQNITSNITLHPKIHHLNNPEEIYQAIIKNNYQLIKDIFSQLDIYLSLQKDFDTFKSGCTCVLIVQIGPKIICANVGDSRAILVYSHSPNLFSTKIFPLSIDSKPYLPSELNRIINSGGEVHKRINNKGEYVGPMRVFAKGKDFPGLAMSRSFGDFQCKQYGVINEPSFVEYCLDDNCKYLVLGSDGVWDFLDNENVAKIGNKYYLGKNPEGFCNEILEKAKYWWEKEDSVVDDITTLVVFFNFFV